MGAAFSGALVATGSLLVGTGAISDSSARLLELLEVLEAIVVLEAIAVRESGAPVGVAGGRNPSSAT